MDYRGFSNLTGNTQNFMGQGDLHDQRRSKSRGRNNQNAFQKNQRGQNYYQNEPPASRTHSNGINPLNRGCRLSHTRYKENSNPYQQQQFVNLLLIFKGISKSKF